MIQVHALRLQAPNAVLLYSEWRLELKAAIAEYSDAYVKS